MIRSKILIRINDINEINNYKKLGISNFLFALEDFSIGYETFKIKELKDIKENIYILVNRVLDNKGIDNFKKIINELSFTKGIIFEDLGIYQLLKDTNIPLIWNQNHFAVNTSSINHWLDRVSSVVISNEIEKNELINILNHVTNKVILPVLGLNMALYSRRYLLSFFYEYKGLNAAKNAILTTNNTEFIASENKYGTVLFYKKYFNLINEIDNFNQDNILFYYIDSFNLKPHDIEDILSGKRFDYDNRFYEHKTVYRVGDLDD